MRKAISVVAAVVLLGCSPSGQRVSVPIVNREAPSIDPNGNAIELHTGMAPDSLFTSVQRLLVSEGYGVEFSDRDALALVSGSVRVESATFVQTYTRARVTIDGSVVVASLDYTDYVEREMVGREGWIEAEYGKNTDVFSFVLRDLRRIPHDSVRVVRR